MIHELRIIHIHNLIATSNGYYITTDLNELQNYYDGLQQRINSITTVAQAIESDLNKMQRKIIKNTTNINKNNQYEIFA